MRIEIVRTILHFVVAVNVAILLTVTYDTLAFVQEKLIAGIPHTWLFAEIFFQLWFFGSNAFVLFPASLPLLILTVCMVALLLCRLLPPPPPQLRRRRKVIS